MLLRRELGFATRHERADVDLEALVPDSRAFVDLVRLIPIRRRIRLDQGTSPQQTSGKSG